MPKKRKFFSEWASSQSLTYNASGVEDSLIVFLKQWTHWCSSQNFKEHLTSFPSPIWIKWEVIPAGRWVFSQLCDWSTICCPTGNKWSLLHGNDKDYFVLTQPSNIHLELKLFCQLVSLLPPSRDPIDEWKTLPCKCVCIDLIIPAAVQCVVKCLFLWLSKGLPFNLLWSQKQKVLSTDLWVKQSKHLAKNKFGEAFLYGSYK